jgi:SAM-dependent methyltransferase
MLRLEKREASRLRVLHDAEELPFPDDEFAVVAALLCDGFLGLGFLSEARRVLATGGVLCGTTPSYEWGATLREDIEIDLMSTRFELRGGGQIVVPSYLYRQVQLRGMLERVGFHEVEIHAHTVPADVLEVSDDVTRPAEQSGVAPHELPILYSFWAIA